MWYPLTEEGFSMRTLIALTVVSVLALGCATATPTQKGAVTGSAIGAGLGAIIGHQSGETGKGALIGAAAGGLAGGLLGDAMANQFCPTCGRTQFSNMTNCPVDGTPLRAKGAIPQTAQQQRAEDSLPKFCATCGRSYPASASYCAEDGTSLKQKTS